MAISIDQRPDEDSAVGDRAQFRKYYVISGSDSAVDVRIALANYAPVYVDVNGDLSVLIYREGIQVNRIGEDLWDGEVSYSSEAIPGQNMPPQFRGTTKGATAHITNSRRTSGKFGRTLLEGAPPDFHGAIGVTDGSIEGVDIVIPTRQFTETYSMEPQNFINNIQNNIELLTGSVNIGPFRGFDPEEVLFLGADWERVGSGYFIVSFDFTATRTVSGITIPGFDGANPITKTGQHYLWILYQDEEDTAAHALVRRPVAVYTEEVYPKANFSLLGIGTN